MTVKKAMPLQSLTALVFSIHGRLDRVKFLFGRPAALKASDSAIRKIRNPDPVRYKREVQIHA
jgi:hypothetical protein